MDQGQEKPKGEKPINELLSYPFKFSHWEKEKTNQQGQSWVEHSFKLTKSFKREGSDHYEEQTIVLFEGDLLVVRALMDKAYGDHVIRHRFPRSEK